MLVNKRHHGDQGQQTGISYKTRQTLRNTLPFPNAIFNLHTSIIIVQSKMLSDYSCLAIIS